MTSPCVRPSPRRTLHPCSITHQGTGTPQRSGLHPPHGWLAVGWHGGITHGCPVPCSTQPANPAGLHLASSPSEATAGQSPGCCWTRASRSQPEPPASRPRGQSPLAAGVKKKRPRNAGFHAVISAAWQPPSYLCRGTGMCAECSARHRSSPASSARSVASRRGTGSPRQGKGACGRDGDRRIVGGIPGAVDPRGNPPSPSLVGQGSWIGASGPAGWVPMGWIPSGSQ